MTTTARLDAFTDSAFAFALTLMVIGGAGAIDEGELWRALAAIPSFAIGFAIVVLFWFAHVRWRGLRGDGDWRSIVLTLLLIFLVLIYIVPLRAMAIAFAGYLTATRTAFDGRIGTLFAIYGAGFAAMAMTVALLFRDALPAVPRERRAAVRGEIGIWAILTATGVASTVLALISATRLLAPFLYATLPMTIGAFAARWRWDATPA